MKKTEIVKKVLKDFEKRRKDAEMKAEQNLKFALTNGKFERLFKRIKELNFDIAKQDFLGKDVSSQNKELEKTKKEAEKVLKTLGLSFDDFEPKYCCEKCKDKGIVGDGYCDCFYKQLNQEIIKNLGIEVDKSHCFENTNFEIFDDPKKAKVLYEKMFDWCQKLHDTKFKNLLLCGAPGVGKTYLAQCITNELLKKNIVINFYTSFALNNLFLKFHTTFDNTKSSILEGVLNCDVLIVDDLGSEQKYKNVTEEYLYLVLNERLTSGKTTIVTTNLTPEQILDKYGERSFSRLCNKASTIMLKLENSDLRLKKR